MRSQHPLKIIRNQKGIAAIYMASSLAMLLGMGVLIVDGGELTVLDNQLQIAADVAALAAGADLPDEETVQATAIEYASKQMHSGVHGTVLIEDDVVMGNWDTDTRTFTPAGNPSNAVKVTTRRSEANGNPAQFLLGGLIGQNEIDLAAVAISYRAANNSNGTRFIIDNEMIDKDVPSIEALAASMGGIDPQVFMDDLNGDWFIDLPPGAEIEVPTGQVGDEGMFDIVHADYPFSEGGDPSHTDFLNYNEDGTWREGLLSDGDLDPLLGVSPVSDPGVYDTFVNPEFVHVSPIYDSDISDLGSNEVNAKGQRKGLLAFQIIDALPDPPGSELPHLMIRIVDPATIVLDDVTPWSSTSTGSGKIRLVK